MITQHPDRDVSSVIITGDLARRPSRAPDHEAEARALAALMEAMSTAPSTVLQRLVEIAMELTRSDSAGISLLEPGGEQGTFRWAATAGAWTPYRNGTMPREQSPCGEVISQETVLLMREPERAFPALLQAQPGVGEGLLAPFNVGGVPAGTVWAIMHGPDRRFEAEDARLLVSLGRFASVAHQMTLTLGSAEAGRLESDTRLQALARASSDVFYTMSPDMTELRALSGGNFIADTTSPTVAWLEDYIPPEDQARTVAATVEAIRTKGVFELEHQVRQVDGGIGWALSRAVPILGTDGKIIEWFGAASDITARKQAEERQVFLLRLSDALRAEPSAEAIATRALQMLSERLQLDRCYVGVYRLAKDIGEFPHQVHDDRLLPLPAQVRLSDFPEALRVAFDRTLVVNDVVAMEGLSDSDRASFHGLGLRALIAATLRKGENNPLWAIVAVSTCPRAWTQTDVSLVEEVAERTWAAVERARAEVALDNSEARALMMADAAPVLIWETDAAGIIFVNAHYLDFFGVTADDVRRMGWTQFLHPEDAAGYLAAYGQAFENSEAYAFECRFRRSDGQYRWLRNSGVPVGANRFVGSSVDVTDLLEAQQQVTESEARFQQFSNASTNILWIRDAATMRMAFASPAFDAIYGIAGPERGGDPSLRAWARLIEPENRKNVLANFRRVRNGERIEVEFAFKRASDGALRWVHNTDFPLHDAAGNVRWLAGLGADITDVKEAADRQGVLVAELQHRTRNLIAVVRSLSDRTLDTAASLDDFGKRFRPRLAALSRVQGLLSHLAAGERVTFKDLLCAELIAHGVANGKSDNLTLDGPADVPLRSATVQTLALALHELATNALKYGAFSADGGHLTVRWYVEPAVEDAPPFLNVEWRESGVVMPQVSMQAHRSGYGRELIERALPYQLKAKTSYELGADGVRCTITVPISRVTVGAVDDA